LHNTVAERFSMSAYWRLARPGLLAAMLFSMAIAALTADQPPPWPRLARALLGTSILIAGASALNQLMERRWDAAMERTASRPLPSGRLTVWQALTFAALASLAGIGYLAAMQTPAVTLLAASSWIIYVLIYTPLKRVSVWQPPVGAVAGAIPVLIGAATANAVFTPISLALVGIVFFWQFPHTAAIGWIYREQYARGGVKVASVVDPSGRLAGRLALVGAVGLLLVSIVPATRSTVGWPYVVIAVSLGLAHVVFASQFLGRPSDASARALWRISMVHLPTLLTTLLLN
jgi:heme o synthase